MERTFDEELGFLRRTVLEMAGLAQDSVESSVEGLRQRKENLLRDVFRNEEAINGLEVGVDDACHRLLALRQPVANDLRLIVGALRISGELERIGDHSVNIAEQALELINLPALKPLLDIPEMARHAQSMVKDAIDAFVRGDETLARDVCARDDRLDQFNQQVFRELLTYMMEDRTTIPRAVDLILVARNLERIGDHATNISEAVVYMLRGKIIKHHCETR